MEQHIFRIIGREYHLFRVIFIILSTVRQSNVNVDTVNTYFPQVTTKKMMILWMITFPWSIFLSRIVKIAGNSTMMPLNKSAMHKCFIITKRGLISLLNFVFNIQIWIALNVIIKIPTKHGNVIWAVRVFSNHCAKFARIVWPAVLFVITIAILLLSTVTLYPYIRYTTSDLKCTDILVILGRSKFCTLFTCCLGQEAITNY